MTFIPDRSATSAKATILEDIALPLYLQLLYHDVQKSQISVATKSKTRPSVIRFHRTCDCRATAIV
jgi:hypothetical protein